MAELQLLMIAERENIEIREMKLRGRNKGIYFDRVIAIKKKLSTSEYKCILAEELGHHFTTIGDITDQTKIENRKQEKQARAWAYEKLISLDKLVQAFEHGCRNRFETAEYLEVTEEFFDEAITHYKEKHGLFYSSKNFTIYFEPLGILKMFEDAPCFF